MRPAAGLRLGDCIRVGAAAAEPSTLLNDLVSYWTLNETSGTRADSVGDNDLTDNNTVGSDTGKNDKAASFVRANEESLTVNTLIPDRTASFTMSLWFYNTSDTDYQMIATAGQELEFRRNTGAYELIGILGGVSSAAIAFTANAWHNAVMYYDDSAGEAYIQVDGASPVAITGTPSQAVSGTVLDIGRRNDGYYFQGMIDEIGVWSRVLTEDERAELYNSGSGKFYPFT